LNFGLGSSKANINAIMVNLVGDKGFSGPVIYQGIEEAMELNNVSVHIYGKSETKPNRKMGHVTIIDKDLKAGLSKAKSVKNLIKVKTN
jgi:5-(carboxyamino)imidazole ribonucleotide synthase